MLKSNAAGLCVPALKVRQNGHDLFMVDLTADDLLKYTKVDKWKAGQAPADQGYQREELQAHYNKVGRYLTADKNAILPTTILLSARKGVTFEPLDEHSTMGHLHIPEDTLPLWIVDGQHRVAGLRHAIEDLGDEGARKFTLPAVIMANMPKFDEVQQFYIVNSTSKRIKTDLAERLLTEMAEQDDKMKATVIGKGKAYLLRAVKIVEVLNNQAGGPWEGRIQNVNKRKVGDVMIAESSFNESLKPILAIPWVLRMSDAEVAKIVGRYWEAIFSYMPNALATPRNYSVQKTIGTYTWHLVAPAVFEVCRTDMDFTADKMADILKPCQEYLDEAFWEVGNTDGAAQYSSRAASRSCRK
jgi:DGQHR domain-containing protein